MRGRSNPIGIAPYVLPNTTTVNAPPCIPDPVNGGNFELAPITPSWCTPLTTAGAKVVTLYTTYMLPTPSSTITANLKSTDPSIEQYYDWRMFCIAELHKLERPNIPPVAASEHGLLRLVHGGRLYRDHFDRNQYGHAVDHRRGDNHAAALGQIAIRDNLPRRLDEGGAGNA